MEVRGTYTFDAPIARVWDLLMDPTAVGECIPGCERLRPLGDDRYDATLSIAVSAITGTYQGTVTIVDKVPPRSYRLIVEGSGRPGFVRGQSLISLSEQSEKTIVEVGGEVDVGGLIARVGQRLLASVSKMMMDRFYTCLQRRAASTLYRAE